MKIPSLRTLVSCIGLLVVAATCLSGPVGYALVAFGPLDSEVAFRARLGAEHVAKLVYRHPLAWEFQAPRLAELIDGNSPQTRHVRQRITAANGETLVELGPAPAAPVLTRSAPVEVSGREVGRAEIAVSLRPLILNTALAAVVSCLLAVGMYFAVRRFPLAVLDQTLGELERRDAALCAQNARFDAALNNMSQGLIMFDAGGPSCAS